MTKTPWGNAAALRERKLRPGRGTPREEAERNQRERLFAAMVATVAEEGYEATTAVDGPAAIVAITAAHGLEAPQVAESHFADGHEPRARSARRLEALEDGSGQNGFGC